MSAYLALPPGPPDPQQLEALSKQYGMVVVGSPLAVTLGLV
jgi:hypothetical protein